MCHSSFEFFLLSIYLSIKFLFKYQNTPLNWWIGNITRGRCLKEMLFVHLSRGKLLREALVWSDAEVQVGCLFWSQVGQQGNKWNTWRVLVFWEFMESTGDQLMRGMPGLTWLCIPCASLLSQSGSAHWSVCCGSEMCEFSPVFVGKCVLPFRVLWRHLWQITAAPKHTDPGQFFWAGAWEVLPAEHTA